jgi:hypothetical protein
MVRTPKPESEKLSYAGAASVEEARLFHEIVKHHPLPPDVRRVEFRFGEDSAGAPAVWIVFVAKNDLNPTEATISAIRRVAEGVRSEVRSTGSERWPYIAIEAE